MAARGANAEDMPPVDVIKSVSDDPRWRKCLMAAQRFGDGLMQGNLRRAQQARAQSIRERRTKDRDRMEDLPTLEQFRAGNAYACMTLCVCVCVSPLPVKTCLVPVCVMAVMLFS